MSRFVWLAIAAGCAAFSVGNFTAPVLAWLGPIFMLRFMRQSSPWQGAAAGLAAFIVAQDIAWRGAIIFQGATYHAVVAGVAAVFFVPYVVDRLLAPRLKGFAATLVFPSALAVTEFAWSSVGLGTWGVAAYAQTDLQLLQVLSVAGLWGVAFLIGWVAAVVNLIWETGGQGVTARRAVLLLAGAAGTVIALGALRLTLDAPSAPTVRIAGISAENLDVFKAVWGPVSAAGGLSPEGADRARPLTHALQRTLLERSRQEARAGAKLVLWSEANALVLKDDEARFVAEAGRLAAAERIYLFMAMATITPGQPLAENKVVAIDPTGAVRSTYLKSRPTPVERSVRGEGRMPVMDTPYGRIAWAICYDFDYHELIRQAGRAGADILLDPSWDSRGMAPMHSNMAAMRAIENGAALFRMVNDGRSLAVDHQGRVLAAMDDFRSSDPVSVMIAEMPTRGARTLYARCGDWLPWAALFTLGGLGVVAFRARKMALD